MLDFKSIVKFATKEIQEERNIYYTEKILKSVLRHTNKVINTNPSMDEKQVFDNIKKDVFKYLEKINDTDIFSGTIEYYLNTKLNSTSEYNLQEAYKDVCKEEKEQKKETSYDDISKLQYGYDLDENLRMLVKVLLYNIRFEKDIAKKTVELIWNNPEKRQLLIMSEKQRKTALRRMGCNDELIDNMQKTIKLFKKSEFEVLNEDMKTQTDNKLRKIKQECINKIIESVKILDSIGLLEEYKNSANRIYGKIKLNNCKYDDGEIQQLVSYDNLKKLSFEQLIAMSSFWINRVNKIIPGLNNSLYIVNHLLDECTVIKDGEKQIEVPQQYLEDVELKKRVLHKISHELFLGLEDKGSQENLDEVVKEQVQTLVDKYGYEYEQYFDECFPHLENSLEKDLMEGLCYENTIYNSYKIKDINMQSILISLLNNNLSKIENFGYIKDNDVDISKKKYILIGIDLQGMNMPLRLHINKDMLIEMLKESQNGSTLFPIYKGSEDFLFFDSASYIPTHIYVPMSKEKKKQLQEDKKKVSPSGNLMKTIEHLCYIAGVGKMPKHMKNSSSPQYIDLVGTDDELDR